MQCEEYPEEPMTSSSTVHFKLSCNITTDVNTLQEGIKLGL